MEVVLVRHGETAWSRNGQHTGRTDIPLTDEGRRQAKLLGQRLRRWSFALVLTSPLSRATETCALAGLNGTACDHLLEWDYGDYEGRTTPEIRTTREGWLLWIDGVPNGETLADVGRRADRVIERVRAVDGDVALFAHGHVLRVLAARWLGLPPQAGCHFALSPATLSVLGWEHEVPAILRWNDGSHLEEVTERCPPA